MARYLVDASALYPLVLKLREELLDRLPLVAVLDLTVYEVGNTIWKEYRARRVRDPKALAAVFGEVLSGVGVVRVGSEEVREVLELAVAEGITFYDAAYLYAARKLGLKLVTEDSDLKKYPESLDAEGFIAELERSK
jgi:predicted nucleic acid-binding protein